MVVYMEVTDDEYELPVAVADSVQMLAKTAGIKASSILQMISHEKAGTQRSKYKRIEIEDDGGDY